MCAKYSFYKKPPRKENPESSELYAKVVGCKSVGTDRLAQEISANSSFSSADVKGILSALSERLIFHLKYGENVELEGIGHFGVTLKCPKGVVNPKQIRAESIAFNNVSFRCSKQLKNKLKALPLERADNLPKREQFPDEIRREHILSEIKEKQFLSSTDCMIINQCSRYQALKDLNHLLEQGQIMRIGRGKQRYYGMKKI
ncbi:HU family DNA-binding protein [Parabacteroides chinchillae]|uniref:Viral histone-like protein n=1 Tax=Parabacteroides chinchillae TaxID=871327 RepID=A0A8G2BYT6_9BACT|nr:HU family DNA-binding protein [Parabacteroides chinchillae]SEG24096.1 DNA-binding protein, histone-like, putative [Parabacteroides chinchillae]